MKSKIFAFLIMLTVATTSASAQEYLFGLSYATAAPLGETADFTSPYSWRGIAMEARWFLNDNTSLGFFTAWNVFYEKETGRYTEGTRTLSGTQLRYVNAFPILLEGHYHFGSDMGTRPYVSLGLGPYRTRQRTEMGIFAAETNKWQFGLAPGAGILVPVSYGLAVHLGLKYNYVLQAGDALNHSWIGINLGLAWSN